MSTAALVRAVLWMTLPTVEAAARSWWSVPDLRRRYPRYLATMHGLIRASVPLMEAALAECDRLPAGDPVAEPLRQYLRDHITEERDHDAWLLEDLAEFDPSAAIDVLADRPATDVAALAGSQYYWIRHYHPACLLGYIAVLEGCAPAATLVDELPALTGLPPTAFRTLAGHALLDLGHQHELDQLLLRLPLPERVASAMARNAAETAEGAAALLRRLATAPDDPVAPPGAAS